MAIDILVPQMGESVTEGVIAQWLKNEGDTVSADEPLVEVETDKITVEVPAPSAGVLTKQSAGEGDTVNVGDIIGMIEAGGAAAAAPAPAAAAAPAPAPAPASNGAPAMPAARAEAQRSGVDLGTVDGTGRGGRVLKEDVQRAAAAPAPAPAAKAPAAPPAVSRPAAEGRETRKKMTPLRRRVAERLVQSQHTAAILTTFNEVDMSAVIALRSKWKQKFVDNHGVKLGFMSFFVKAAIKALKAFPPVNAELDGEEVVYKHYYDIGVAVGGGKGLVVPVIRDADRLSFAEIEKAIGDYGKRAKDNKLTLDELTGGTFTISNGGVYGSMLSTPILNPPQTGILGLHNIVERAVVVDGKVEVRPVMYLALSYDHRLIDGREAVRFLVTIKEALEDPERLFLGV
jgi:2-oxoglutarate dehydrogenase E2 component (dihydrolipoamide succinyltransferase)